MLYVLQTFNNGMVETLTAPMSLDDALCELAYWQRRFDSFMAKGYLAVVPA